MVQILERDGCLYQDDVVDYLVKNGCEVLLRENADGNQVLAKPVLDIFLTKTKDSVVWVKPDFYWRWRVAEDEPGRNARG
ncbi:ATP-dependent RNA helicase HrpA [Edwardsiella piscicida]|nr:ATP-dependent RNA helicase HrpA [Edwardsiella piscicida]